MDEYKSALLRALQDNALIEADRDMYQTLYRSISDENAKLQEEINTLKVKKDNA